MSLTTQVLNAVRSSGEVCMERLQFLGVRSDLVTYHTDSGLMISKYQNETSEYSIISSEGRLLGEVDRHFLEDVLRTSSTQFIVRKEEG